MPPKRTHGHERDATQLASSGSVPTEVPPKPHVTALVWCVRRCTIKGSNRSSQQRRPWKLREFLCVACQEDVFRVENPFLISTADVSRAHFCAVSERDENVHLPTRTQRQRSQAHVDNYERRCTDPWTLLNSGLQASEISELRRTAKWHAPPDEIKEEDDFLTGKN